MQHAKYRIENAKYRIQNPTNNRNSTECCTIVRNALSGVDTDREREPLPGLILPSASDDDHNCHKHLHVGS